MSFSQQESNTPIIKIIAEFDTVIDMDLSMMKLVQEKYNNPKFIKQDIMYLSLHDVKEELLNRTHESPLSICIDDLNIANSLCQELTEQHYSEILENHTKTGVFKLMEIYNKNDSMEVYILCSCQEEADIIKSYDSAMKCIIKKHDKIDITKYDIYFLKSLPRIFVFNGKFVGKHIFVMGYMYNLYKTPDGTLFPHPEVARALIPDNRIGIVDVYEKSENIHIRRTNTIDE